MAFPCIKIKLKGEKTKGEAERGKKHAERY